MRTNKRAIFSWYLFTSALCRKLDTERLVATAEWNVVFYLDGGGGVTRVSFKLQPLCMRHGAHGDGKPGSTLSFITPAFLCLPLGHEMFSGEKNLTFHTSPPPRFSHGEGPLPSSLGPPAPSYSVTCCSGSQLHLSLPPHPSPRLSSAKKPLSPARRQLGRVARGRKGSGEVEAAGPPGRGSRWSPSSIPGARSEAEEPGCRRMAAGLR